MAEIAVSVALALVEIVTPFLQREINLKHDVQNNIECIRDSMAEMRALLHEIEREEQNKVVKEKLRQSRELAYDMDDILSEFMFRLPHLFHRHQVSRISRDRFHFVEQRRALHEFSSRIQDIRGRVENFRRTMDQLRSSGMILDEGPSSGARLMNHLSYWSATEDEIVGYQRLLQRILSQLLSEESKRFAVSITGPAGSGKTFLAKKVLEDHRVHAEFHFVFWVRVSCTINLEVLLQNIELQLLGHLGNNPLPLQGNGTSLRGRLKGLLEKRKYLIVIDDVWRNDDWGCILDALPVGTGGSRIIVTSCNRDVAFSCVSEAGYLHELEGLSWKDAWNLFCKNAFRSNGGECPLELQEWAQKIVKKCEGLPLAVKTVGSLLANKSPIPIQWKTIYDSIGTDPSIVRSLCPGYKDLRTQPDLKSCFLYFGIFPEDYCVQREILIRLWVAEGFVKEERNRSSEEAAEHNLNELE